MFQALQLTEFVLVHGVPLKTVLKLFGYFSVSFIPTILPMSLLLAVLLAYGQMSNNSEIVAFKSMGLSTAQLSAPTVILSLLCFLISAYTAFYMAPWGHRQFETLSNKIGQNKATASIQEGTFSGNFFDLVVYANKIDTKKNHLKEVFIYDERDKTPITIVAKEGFLHKKKGKQQATLELKNGDIHRQQDHHTKIHFETYRIQLSNPEKNSYKKKTRSSLNYEDIKSGLKKYRKDSKKRIPFEIELYKRWALAFACLIFGLLGVSLGMNSNRRSGKSEGMTLATAIIVSYWVLYMIAENAAKNGLVPVALATWSPNILFSLYMIQSIRSEK